MFADLRSASAALIVLAALAAPAAAQGVQPRYAPPVEDRSGATRAVEPRQAAQVRDTSLRGVPAGSWPSQRLGDTGVTRSGVAPGLQLRNIRCAGVTCRAFEDSAGDWVVAVEGGFPGVPGSTLEATTLKFADQTQVEARTKGVFSDGRFRDSVSTYRLAPGSYGVAYHLPGGREVYAAVQFDVVRHALPEPGPATAAQRAQSLDAAAAARRAQYCQGLRMARPDATCTP